MLSDIFATIAEACIDVAAVGFKKHGDKSKVGRKTSDLRMSKVDLVSKERKGNTGSREISSAAHEAVPLESSVYAPRFGDDSRMTDMKLNSSVRGERAQGVVKTGDVHDFGRQRMRNTVRRMQHAVVWKEILDSPVSLRGL